MSMSQEHSFNTSCPDLLSVLRILEPLVASAIRSPRLRPTRGYYVSGGSTNMHDVTDLKAAYAVFPGEPDYILREYGTKISAKPYYRVRLTLHKYGGRVEGDLDVKGPSTHETVGLFERLRTTFDKEIARQEESDWTAAPLELSDKDPGGIPADGPMLRIWKVLTTHPIWVGIIVAVVAGLVGLAFKWLGLDPENQKPPVSTTTTQTQTQSPNSSTTPLAPATSSGNVDINQPRTRGDDQPTHPTAPGQSPG